MFGVEHANTDAATLQHANTTRCRPPQHPPAGSLQVRYGIQRLQCVLYGGTVVPPAQSVIRSLLVMDAVSKIPDAPPHRNHTGTGQSCKSHIGSARMAEWLRRGRRGVGHPLYSVFGILLCSVQNTHRSVSGPVSGNLRWDPGHRWALGPGRDRDRIPIHGRRRKTQRVCCRLVVACCHYLSKVVTTKAPARLRGACPQTKPAESDRSIRSLWCSVMRT